VTPAGRAAGGDRAAPVAAAGDACAGCLRRGYLIGLLAPRIAAAVSGRGRGRLPGGLLALPDDELVRAVCGERSAGREAWRLIDGFDPDAARADLARAGIAATCPHGGAYPPALLALTDPPAALFVAGGIERFAELAQGRVVAVVGTRRPSPYGLEMARHLGRGLAAAGMTVVSGLALGIDAAAHRGALDAAAHRGALDAPGRAIAVLARGPDASYPRTNRDLYARLRQKAAVVSELPPGVPVFRWSFPARNRIMAALAEMTVVVEADDPSGSLITARFAAQIGRTVGAVPGRATARVARGTNGLLRDGANVVLGPEDVLDAVLGVSAAQAAGGVRDVPVLSPELARVLEAVESCDGVEAIGRRAGLSPGDLRGALARLELLRLIRRDGLGGYERAAAP
jgi:DNA processing protein